MIVPAKGTKASAVDAPMRLWLRIRRRASARVHQMSANQTATPKTTSGTTRLSEIVGGEDGVRGSHGPGRLEESASPSSGRAACGSAGNPRRTEPARVCDRSQSG